MNNEEPHIVNIIGIVANLYRKPLFLFIIKKYKELWNILPLPRLKYSKEITDTK